MARRSCFDEVGLFNPVLHVGGDIDMWLRLSMKYAVGYIPESLGKVRVHPQNVTSQRSFEVLKSSQTAFIERALEGLKSAPDYHFLKRKAYFGLYCYLAEECARGGHLAKGFRYALKALITCPELLLNVEGISFFMVVARGFLPREFRGIGKRALMAVGLR